jgi:uroporphyrinogen-III synthase
MQAAEDKGLRIDILAPTPEAPSMTMAIENYIKAAK